MLPTTPQLIVFLSETTLAPFGKATAVRPRPPFASSAPVEVTVSGTAPKTLSKTALQSHQLYETAISSLSKEVNASVASGTSNATQVAATTETRKLTVAPSAEVIASPFRRPVERSPLAENEPVNTHTPPLFAHILDPSSTSPPPPPAFPFNLLSEVMFRSPPSFRSSSHEKTFSRIATPYDPDAFEFLLDKHNLTDQYPFLVRNLRNGFPMGEFPDLPQTVIFPQPCFHHRS